MSVADVERAVRLVMATAQAHGPWLAGNETAVRYALVDPILWALDWSAWSPLQCRPNFKLGKLGVADYALLDLDGNVAVVIAVGTVPGRRRRDRERLRVFTRGMSQRVAVLTYGTRWEIYELNRRVAKFTDKLAESLSFDADASDNAENIVRALHYWLRQDLWWEWSE